QNAEDGLKQVREALHLLRSWETTVPAGREGVERMIGVFVLATGVQVEHDFSGIDWNGVAGLGFVIYHLVQETLMNSFRHGKATRVRIFTQKNGGNMLILIRDNGRSAEEFEKGIGITGMTERLTAIGGTLAARPLADGFEVTATVPFT
ncbi:MAG: hypothetical protein HN368_16185, partial [Spirochaetales bacterium]|nr:hypothetical protein [Spirochaetales bacterium]